MIGAMTVQMAAALYGGGPGSASDASVVRTNAVTNSSPFVRTPWRVNTMSGRHGSSLSRNDSHDLTRLVCIAPAAVQDILVLKAKVSGKRNAFTAESRCVNGQIK